jgi:hypothetical protein
MDTKRTPGFWIIIIVSLLILLMLVFGQVMAFIDYEFAESLGLQEPEDDITAMGVAANKGFGVGDTLIYLPMLVIGLIGLWTRKRWGVFAMVGAMAITAYWPMVNLFLLIFARDVPGFSFDDYATYTILLTGITLFGLWGIWYLYSRREVLAAKSS